MLHKIHMENLGNCILELHFIAVGPFSRNKSLKHPFHWFHVTYVNFSALRSVQSYSEMLLRK